MSISAQDLSNDGRVVANAMIGKEITHKDWVFLTQLLASITGPRWKGDR